MNEGFVSVVEGIDAGGEVSFRFANDAGEAFDHGHKDVFSRDDSHARVFVEVNGDSGAGDIEAGGVCEV